MPLTGFSAGELVVTPAGNVTSTGFARGPFSVTETTYTVSNTSASSFNWSVGKNRPWISLTPASGTLGAGESVDVQVLANSLILELPVGADVASLSFINLENFEQESRTFTMDIGLPGAGSADPLIVDVENQYQITLTGEPGTEYVIEEADLVTGPWNPTFTNLFSGTSATFDFLVGSEPSRFFRSFSTGAGATAATLTVTQIQGQDATLVEVIGDPFGVYIIEATINMVDWAPIYTNKVPVSGSFTFTNALATETTEYRAIAAGELTLPMFNHVLIAGESLAIGFDGDPALSTTPVGNNHRFSSRSGSIVLIPLRETILESIASASAAYVASSAPLHNMLMSNIGQNGALYEDQAKGTPLYDLGLDQFQDAPQAVACALFEYRPRAIFVLGGEGDQLKADYGQDLRQWQADYQGDIQFATGSTETIPMFHSQISAWTSLSGGAFETVLSPYEVLAESEANPTRTILVGPRYFLPYVGAEGSFPGLHPTNEGYRWLAEYYGKAYKQVIVDGGTWSPLKPATVTRSGAVITATFDVPTPPLVLDTTLVTDPGDFGFEFYDDSGTPPTITGVTLTGPDTVEITLSAEPVGADERLRYAYTGIPLNSGGPVEGPRGNLRDSDASASLFGNTLYNWCVHFDKPVN
jgi:hypothetical protein